MISFGKKMVPDAKSNCQTQSECEEKRYEMPHGHSSSVFFEAQKVPCPTSKCILKESENGAFRKVTTFGFRGYKQFVAPRAQTLVEIVILISVELHVIPAKLHDSMPNHNGKIHSVGKSLAASAKGFGR